MSTTWRLVLPRTMESSMTTTRLPSEPRPDGVELEADARLAQLLGGLDEGAGDVAALDQPLAVRNSALLGIPDRGRRAGIG